MIPIRTEVLRAIFGAKGLGDAEFVGHGVKQPESTEALSLMDTQAGLGDVIESGDGLSRRGRACGERFVTALGTDGGIDRVDEPLRELGEDG
jgi:hypothetical protein